MARQIETQISMQHRKYSAWDDYFVHQLPDPLEVMGAGEGEFMEHNWVVLFPPQREGPFLATMSMIHPNRRVIHSVARLMPNADTQYNLHLSRQLSHDREGDSLSVGPYKFQVIEPLNRYRLFLAASASAPFSFDLDLESRSRPQLYAKRFYEDQDPGAPFFTEQCHTAHFLWCKKGTLSVDGKVHDMTGCSLVRDRCWGKRRGLPFKRGLMWAMGAVFSDCTIWTWHEELHDGTVLYSIGSINRDNGEVIHLVDQEHEVTFEKGTGDIARAEWVLTGADGKKRQLSAGRIYRGIYWSLEALGDRATWGKEEQLVSTAKLSQAPDPIHVGFERQDLSKVELLERLKHQQREQYCQITLDGEVGYGVVEYQFSSQHVKYASRIV